MPISPELLDELLKAYHSPDDRFGQNGLLQQLTKAVVERAMQAEMTHHLGYPKHAPKAKTPVTRATAPFRKPFAVSAANCRSRCRATARVSLNPNSSRKARPASTASMTRSSPCTRGA